eukprot:6620201-Pyramimonas_sp.AAC.1
MGFAWSLYFCQNANIRLSGSVPLLHRARLLSDRGESALFETGAPVTDLWRCVYVGNLGVLGRGADTVGAALSEQ